MLRGVTEPLREIVAALAAKAGFDISVKYCTDREMRDGIRSLPARDASALTELHRGALLENVRLAMIETSSRPGRESSVAQQATLPRWRYLRGVSEEAANAYVAVLRYHGVVVPNYLLGDNVDG